MAKSSLETASHTSDLLQIETPDLVVVRVYRSDVMTQMATKPSEQSRLVMNTDTDLARISAKTDGDGNSGDSGALLFSTQVTSGSLTERMRISSDGNVESNLMAQVYRSADLRCRFHER